MSSLPRSTRSTRSTRVVAVFASLAAVATCWSGTTRAAAAADEETGTLTGTVVDKDGNPLRSITVATSTGQEAVSRGSGGFTIEDVPAATELTLNLYDGEYYTFSDRTYGADPKNPQAVTVEAGQTLDLGTTVMKRPGSQTSSAAVDLTSKSAVSAAYRQLKTTLRYEPGVKPKGCNAGTTPAATQARTLKAVNYYRSMGGLDPVRLSSTYSARAQRSSLIMYRNNGLSHDPPRSWKCWSAAGHAGAGSSNLFLGYTAARAVQGYMVDPGAGNAVVGHRRWIMAPQSTAIGSGDVGNANSLYVLGSTLASRATPEWIPWPSPGYFPAQEQPAGRWSFSSTRSDTSLAGARVRVTTSSGRALKVKAYKPEAGYGYQDTLVWEIKDLPRTSANTVVTLTVLIKDIERRGSLMDHTYQVRLFNAR